MWNQAQYLEYSLKTEDFDGDENLAEFFQESEALSISPCFMKPSAKCRYHSAVNSWFGLCIGCSSFFRRLSRGKVL